MKPAFAIRIAAALSVIFLGLGCNSSFIPPFAITEIREPCSNYDPLKQPFFGDTHVHTSYSFDAYSLSVRNDPFQAYEFAKGMPLPLPGPTAQGGMPQTRIAQIGRPLDFLAVTDHSELFGEMQICTLSPEGTPGYDALLCQQMRTGLPNAGAIALEWGFNPILREDGAGPLPFCIKEGVDCPAMAIGMWLDIQAAAEAHYDRSSNCTFTTFVGYEYTSQPSFNNLHRNVIFRNANVVPTPISNVETNGPNIPVLWQLLRENCLEAGTGCDVLTIPHNSNLSGSTAEAPLGRMFPDPQNAAEAEERASFEPLVEMYQHKGSSECRYDRLAGMGAQTVDELCAFEQLPTDVLNPLGPVIPIESFPTRDMVRNALKDGMALAPQYGGINPFKYGFVGSTDTHNGTPGNSAEQNWPGHAGSTDAPYAKLVDGIYLSPGGLAVVWAEENSRDAIFSAMRRKETYGTSGTRPIVRFFGGYEYNTQAAVLCNQQDRVQVGYDLGVPMGSDLPPLVAGKNPRFLVAALMDAGTEEFPGTPLQQIQIIKGWVDAEGQTQEKVLSVVGNDNVQGNEVDTANCAVNPNVGFEELCTVWEDSEFDPQLPAFYYARVMENPSCRWSTFACKAAEVDPFLSETECLNQAAVANQKAVDEGIVAAGTDPFNNCCFNESNNASVSPLIQERAWTSPIWYVPENG